VLARRLGPTFWLLAALFAATVHCSLLLGDRNRATEISRWVLLCIFLVLLITTIFSGEPSSEDRQLYAAVSKRPLLVALLVVWIGYSVLYVLAILGFASARSIFGERLLLLWATSAYTLFFATQSAFLGLKRRKPDA
jgi:hypothetical protein